MIDYEDEIRWQAGMARCKCCGYEWMAVSEVGAEWLQCPNCEKMCGDYKENNND